MIHGRVMWFDPWCGRDPLQLIVVHRSWERWVTLDRSWFLEQCGVPEMRRDTAAEEAQSWGSMGRTRWVWQCIVQPVESWRHHNLRGSYSVNRWIMLLVKREYVTRELCHDSWISWKREGPALVAGAEVLGDTLCQFGLLRRILEIVVGEDDDFIGRCGSRNGARMDQIQVRECWSLQQSGTTW